MKQVFRPLFALYPQIIQEMSTRFTSHEFIARLAQENQREYIEALATYLQPHVLVVDEMGYLSYGPDAANVLFHVVNERHLRRRPMLFTTNKSPLTAWGEVLHDHDLAEAIVDRVLEKGRLVVVDGPSYRTRHLQLDSTREPGKDAARISGKRTP